MAQLLTNTEIAGIIQRRLEEADRMWKEKVSHAQIVGYLEGSLKAIKGYLEDTDKDEKKS